MNLMMWDTAAYEPIMECLRHHQVPERYPDTVRIDTFIGKGLDAGFMAVRDEIVKASGYAVLSLDWLCPLAQWIGGRQCLEVMGGCGSLSKSLSDLGVSIVCTDSYKWENRSPEWFSSPWTEVQQIDALSAIERYGRKSEIIVCSWPYRDDSCYQALMAMRRVNPDATMLFIGELPDWSGSSATADPSFFRAAVQVQDEDFKTAVSAYTTCYLLHDRPMLFR